MKDAHFYHNGLNSVYSTLQYSSCYSYVLSLWVHVILSTGTLFNCVYLRLAIQCCQHLSSGNALVNVNAKLGRWNWHCKHLQCVVACYLVSMLLLKVDDLIISALLNQACRPVHIWFLKIYPVRIVNMRVCLCVCVYVCVSLCVCICVCACVCVRTRGY